VRHGYGVFSARTANIYTMRQLRQLAVEAAGDRRPLDPVWERDGRSVDALRPAVDPDGLPTDAAVGAARARHLAAVRRLLAEMDVLVFTLGLAETFADRRDGTVFPSAPGVVAGRYDPGRHVLLTLTCRDIVEDFAAFRERVVALRGGRSFRTLLSVSPVPLAATAGGGHILSANAGAKATLRAAAGELAAADETIDYVPAFEIVTNPAARGAFTDATFRDVTEAGVAAVMAAFLAAHDAPAEAAPADLDDAACEEALAAAFGR
jgi:PAS domain-containing protein